MSAIHKALKKANQGNRTTPNQGYNPLSNRQPQKRSLSPYIGLAVIFSISALFVVFWPKKETTMDMTASSPSVVEAMPPSTDLTPETPPTSTHTEKSALDELKPEDNLANVSEVTVQSAEAQPIETAPREETSTAPKEIIAKMAGKEESSTLAVKPPEHTAAVKTPEPVVESKTVSSPDVSNSIVLSQRRWQSQVESYITNDEIERAEALLKQWISASPNDPTPKLWLAKIYVNNGFYLAAEPMLATLNSVDAKGLLGLIYERTERPLLASVTFEELYRSNSNHGRWLLFWAINTESSGQLDKSRILYENYINRFASDDAKLTQFAKQRLSALGNS